MKKIISLFQRNYDTDRLVRNEVMPGAEWVLNGEGFATRKFDGTCCLIRDGEIYRRYDAKKGNEPPAGFIAAQEPDKISGHWPGWIKCEENNPNDKWHMEAFHWLYEEFGNPLRKPIPGTYELVGPKINGNTDGFPGHRLIRHGELELVDVPRDYEGIKEYLRNKTIEGIVWHHPYRNMVKIKRKDFFK